MRVAINDVFPLRSGTEFHGSLRVTGIKDGKWIVKFSANADAEGRELNCGELTAEYFMQWTGVDPR